MRKINVAIAFHNNMNGFGQSIFMHEIEDDDARSFADIVDELEDKDMYMFHDSEGVIVVCFDEENRRFFTLTDWPKPERIEVIASMLQPYDLGIIPGGWI